MAPGDFFGLRVFLPQKADQKPLRPAGWGPNLEVEVSERPGQVPAAPPEPGS